MPRKAACCQKSNALLTFDFSHRIRWRSPALSGLVFALAVPCLEPSPQEVTASLSGFVAPLPNVPSPGLPLLCSSPVWQLMSILGAICALIHLFSAFLPRI